MSATRRTYRYWSFQLDNSAHRWDSNTEITEGASVYHGQKAVNVQVHEATYYVGQVVQVNAFGRWRNGVVDKLNPKKVVVTFVRNQLGEQSTRSFAPNEIR